MVQAGFMLKEAQRIETDAEGVGFVALNVRPMTRRLYQELAKKLRLDVYELAHALVEAEAKAQGLAK